MDAFFASVEQRDFPELRGKPVAVGGNRDRGVIAAASYEARKFGVRSAMPSKVAARLCPELIFVKHRFEVYREVSGQIRDIFHEYTDAVEPLSLDEAFLDVTRNKNNLKSATIIAERIRREIKATTNLTASAGVSINKFLAKVASDVNKPDGLTLIGPDQVDDFIATLPIEQFFGIGKVTAAKMKGMGIRTGGDLQRYDRPTLVKHFGKAGGRFFHLCRGEDNRPVRSNRPTKSVSAENTFDVDLVEVDEMLAEIQRLSERVHERLAKKMLEGKTVTVKIRNTDFSLHTRSKSVEEFFSRADELYSIARELMLQEPPDKPVRLLGVGISKLNLPEAPRNGQLTLSF